MGAILRNVLVIATSALGVLFGIGFLLSALFEIQGFGDRDSTPSGWRLFEYCVGFAACVLVPATLWRMLLPRSAPVRAVAFALVVIGLLAILGMSVARAGS